jgi:hypothetical protein
MSRTAPTAHGSIPRTPATAISRTELSSDGPARLDDRDADPGDIPERMARAAKGVLAVPRIAEAVAFEAALLVYAFAGLGLKPRTGPAVFSTHREAAWSSVALGLALATLVEVFPVHVLVHRANPPLAWILTGLSAWGLLWLLGDYHALRLRPIVLEPGALRLRVGLRTRARVPFAAISSVLEVRGDPPPRRARGYARATVFGDPTVVIELGELLDVTGPYGRVTRVTRLGLAPDERARFLGELRQAIAKAPGARPAAPTP